MSVSDEQVDKLAEVIASAAWARRGVKQNWADTSDFLKAGWREHARFTIELLGQAELEGRKKERLAYEEWVKARYDHTPRLHDKYVRDEPLD